MSTGHSALDERLKDRFEDTLMTDRYWGHLIEDSFEGRRDGLVSRRRAFSLFRPGLFVGHPDAVPVDHLPTLPASEKKNANDDQG